MYEAIDRDLEIPVALKILRPDYAGVAGAEARFRKEATTAARLRHPNIVTIRDVGTADGTVFVAMDLLPLSLARRLDVLPRLPETEVVRFALDVAAALSIAHADGVVHRDIKPDNVLLGANGEAVVADFGLAGAFSGNEKGDMSKSPTNEVLGTPHYFSPEQARGLDMDGRADLYALGVMCYRAATGRLPFEGDDWYAVAKQHIEDSPIPPRHIVPELSEGFEAIVLKLMAKEPEKRFASATQLADALLVLPSAPTGRSMALISNAVTQVASPYINAVVIPAKRSASRRIAYAGVAILLLAVIGVMALPSTGDYSLQSLFGSAPPAVVATRVDSLVIAPKDTATLKPDSIPPLVVATKPVVRPGTALKPDTKGHMEFSASDTTAQLWVDEVRVGHGKWLSKDYVVGHPHHLRAALEGADAGCASAKHDTTVTLTSADPVARVALDVAPCTVLALTVKSTDAEYTLTALDFKSVVKGRYTGPTVPVVLRNGRYSLKVQSMLCTEYNDTVTVAKSGANSADTVSRVVKPLCN